MAWKDALKGDSVGWLLEQPQPALRHMVLRDLLDRPADDAELLAARAASYQTGPIVKVLDAMQPEGYWVKPGPGYGPKYKSTVWALQLLAQLGAHVDGDPRVRVGCQYYLDHALSEGGHFSYNGGPGGTIDCLQGNMLWALVTLGCDDPRLEEAVDWAARSNTGEGVAPKTEKRVLQRYYAYKCGPGFRCGANNGQPCAWGAAKIMLAFSALPPGMRTPLAERAIAQGVEYFFSVPPETALWPENATDHPSRDWWLFSFPVYYITDLLQVAEALARLGCGRDPRMAGLLDFIRAKQDAEGRWPLEYNYASKTWGNYGRKGEPNPWVTLRALRVLKIAEEKH